MARLSRRSVVGMLAGGFVAFITAPIASADAAFAPQIRAGDVCKKVGRRKTSAGKTFECVEQGGVRQWRRAQASTKPQQPTKPDEPSTSEVKVLESSALAVGASQNVVVPFNAGDVDLVVTRSVRGLVAFSRKCTHFGYLVCHSAEKCGRDEGALPDQLVCGYHGSVFSASTGAVIRSPANRALTAYKVTERSGSIYITL